MKPRPTLRFTWCQVHCQGTLQIACVNCNSAAKLLSFLNLEAKTNCLTFQEKTTPQPRVQQNTLWRNVRLFIIHPKKWDYRWRMWSILIPSVPCSPNIHGNNNTSRRKKWKTGRFPRPLRLPSVPSLPWRWTNEHSDRERGTKSAGVQLI